MSVRKVQFVPEECYHIYNRGNSKQIIYKTPEDHRRFMRLLYVANSDQPFKIEYIDRSESLERGEPLVSIGAYCLMPNHFHILLTPCVEGGVSKLMQKISTAYSMYFNKRHERTGALFEGKFKAQHVDSDEYLKYLYAYIHLNPVKLIDPKWKEGGIKDAAKSYDFAASFAYSSLPDYLGVVRPENAIINNKPFPEYFLSAGKVHEELFEWLNFTQN